MSYKFTADNQGLTILPHAVIQSVNAVVVEDISELKQHMMDNILTPSDLEDSSFEDWEVVLGSSSDFDFKVYVLIPTISVKRNILKFRKVQNER